MSLRPLAEWAESRSSSAAPIRFGVFMRNQKEEAIDLIERLPDEVNTADIIEELYFKMQIDEGLRDVAEGRTLSHTELKERLAAWRKSDGP